MIIHNSQNSRDFPVLSRQASTTRHTHGRDVNEAVTRRDDDASGTEGHPEHESELWEGDDEVPGDGCGECQGGSEGQRRQGFVPFQTPSILEPVMFESPLLRT